eukprot:GHRR01020513.1.p1 GENE.GHRR01020513.1~~GHRR01020513.1.p1  ORF type:complete len:160 (-),score=26.43 GHRR01020513.1:245-724(-)
MGLSECQHVHSTHQQQLLSSAKSQPCTIGHATRSGWELVMQTAILPLHFFPNLYGSGCQRPMTVKLPHSMQTSWHQLTNHAAVPGVHTESPLAQQSANNCMCQLQELCVAQIPACATCQSTRSSCHTWMHLYFTCFLNPAAAPPTNATCRNATRACYQP